MVKLYGYHVESEHINWSELLTALPLNIQARYQKRKCKALHKQRASIAAYTILAAALQQYGSNLDQLDYLSSGKPIIKGSALSFSISHSQDRVAVALTDLGAVGLDLEFFRVIDPVESAFLFFSPPEQALIQAANCPNEQLIELWSKKEALVKLLGGQMFDLAAVLDVSTTLVVWDGKSYFLNKISSALATEVWLATDFEVHNIQMKYIERLALLKQTF